MPSPVVVIAGPTASGKSALAVSLAQKFRGEIISADSRQVYRGLDYGSGKITKQEMQTIPHHLIDVASPRKQFSAFQWITQTKKAIEAITGRAKLPIVCGGTNFYLRILTESWQLPDAKPNRTLRKRLEHQTIEELHRQLESLDPRRQAHIDPRNKRRLIRALEIVMTLQQPVPPIRKTPIGAYLFLAVHRSWPTLQKRILTRLLKRTPSIIKEVNHLKKQGLSLRRVQSFGLEYEWFGKYSEGSLSRMQAFDATLRDTQRFAKRQIRELHKFSQVIWVETTAEAVWHVKNFLAANSAISTQRHRD